MNLDKVYEEIKPLCMDSLEVVREVEKLRNYWMPNQVNVILLAESHVFTPDEYFKIKIDYSHFRDLIPNYPDGFVKFVYCIGYSEPQLYKNPPISRSFRNSGTWQFWKIFCACTSDSEQINFDSVLKSGTPNHIQRIQNKIHVLEKMKRMGVWLVDSSIVSVNSFSQKAKREIIKLSWERFVKDCVLDKNPKAVVFIGKLVADILKKDVEGRNIATLPLPQPQERLSSERQSEVLKEYYRFCSKYS